MAFVAIAIAPVAVVGWLAYRSDRALVERDALSTVRLVANARLQMLQFYIVRARGRSANFVDTIAATCPPGPAREECLRGALSAFARDEGALAAELVVPPGAPVRIGAPDRDLRVPSTSGQLAVLRSLDDGGLALVTEARNEVGARLAVERSARPIEEAFLERFGLGDSGETFLSDSKGYFLTHARYGSGAGHSHPIDARPMQQCLAGRSDAMVAEDYRDVVVVHGFRPVPEIGGGCIMAHIDYAEAMQPARALRDRAVATAAVTALLATGLATLLAWLLVAPLERVVAGVRALERGEFDVEVRAEGSSAEVATLAAAFGRLGRAIKASFALEGERAARVEAERAGARQRLLADASTLLSSSFDDARILERFAALVAHATGARCGVRRAPAGAPELSEPVVAGDPTELDPFADGAAAVAPSSVARAPLFVDGAPIGELALAREGVVDDADRALAAELASRLSVGLEQARLYAAVREAVSARDTFIAIASHELRTPLTALKLQVDLLGRGAAARPADLEHRHETIARQVTRLIGLVDGLLDVGRLARGALELQRADVDLAAITREVCERLQPALARAGCELSLLATEPLVGHWDAVRLEQIVVNLLSNAAKYGAGTPIDVEVARDGTRARLTVRDRGIGIAAAEHARIFERFGRAVSERHFGGLGLGLWITREIVAAFGGTISVASVEGEGATFEVTLPFAPPEPPDADPGASERPARA